MALTETRPETNAPPSADGSQASSVEGLLGSGDHKTIGRLFIGGGALGLAGALVVGIVAVFYANNLDDLATGDVRPKAWRDIWGSGQGIGAVKEVMTTAAYVDRLDREYHAAKDALCS